MKRYFPEKGEIRHNGVRQYLEEDLGYLLELTRELTRQEAIYTLSSEPALGRHIGKLRDLWMEARVAFLSKWTK